VVAPRARWSSPSCFRSSGCRRRAATWSRSCSAVASGRRFLLERGPRLGVSHARLAQVDAFFDRHGPKAILIGRFIGIIRAVAPFLAGASGMRLRSFVPWSLLGTGVWATTFTLVGYVFHASFATAAELLTRGALVLAVLAAAVLLVRHRRAAARARARARERDRAPQPPDRA
jgi:membrane protein DedA with SNARE-associated domain